MSLMLVVTTWSSLTAVWFTIATMATLRLTRSANAQMTPNEAMIQNTVPQGGTKNLDSVVSCTTEAVELSSRALLGPDEMIKLVVVLLLSSTFSGFDSFAIFSHYSPTPFLADRTNGRAYATMLRPSSSVVVVSVCRL